MELRSTLRHGTAYEPSPMSAAFRCQIVCDPRHHMRATCVAAALIVAVALPQFLLGLGDRGIWTPLEARYALVAREMLEAGHWVLPHLGGQVYADKPPLLFWSIAFISALGSGVTEWTARLPTALAAVCVCLVTWRLGVRLFSPTSGLMAALVLATSGGFFWSGRQALPDMLLTLWTTTACWAVWEWLAGMRRKAAIAAGACMGLATLSKGPVGLVTAGSLRASLSHGSTPVAGAMGAGCP